MFRAAVLLIAALGVAQAHDIITTNITWSREISRLVNKRCMACHTHNDPNSLFSFVTYEKARPWAKAMKEEAEARRMPPWGAVKGFGAFKDDRGLTQEEIELLAAWVEGGAPEGDPKYDPPAPKPSDWQDPAAPDGASQSVVSSDSKIDSSEQLVAIRPKDMNKGTTVQIFAARPDGTVQPLLWIYQYNPKFTRTFYYRDPVSLPAGTQIVMSPGDTGSTVTLFGKAPVQAADSRTGF
ncbi:MAG: hypothetical protein ACRD30_06365 [Bryobacteraceae bacterium]